MFEANLPLYLSQRQCSGSIANSRLRVQHIEDTYATGAAAHKPHDHEAEGTHRRAKEQRVLRDGYEHTEAELVPDDCNAPYPDDGHRDHVEDEHHQWLVPG